MPGLGSPSAAAQEEGRDVRSADPWSDGGRRART
jgi:hypothetical protein